MDGIIFDVDGTLWDSTDTVAEAWNAAIREHSSLDLVVDRQVLSGLFGKTMEALYRALFPQLSEEERTRLGNLCFEYENRLLLKKPGTLYPGVVETIRSLAKTHDLYIVSNCQCGYIEILLETCHLKPYIKDTLCYGQTGTSKGKTIRTLMKRNHMNTAVYVGDTKGDAEACKEADIPFLFASYGFGEVPEAKHRIERFSELSNLDFSSIV